jgi:hydrogenase maturation protein HypF
MTLRRRVRTVAVRFTGQVQGLGFRPYVYRVATALGVDGSVRNTRRGVVLLAQGRNAERLVARIKSSPPPLARIRSISIRTELRAPLRGFAIVGSDRTGAADVDVLPDIATCTDCRQEIATATDRRCGYPFTNCTQCGPRYSIIEALPYDRPNTTMRRFEMCPDCRREYSDPADRRFHAQPNACPTCGPQLSLLDPNGLQSATGSKALRRAAMMLLSGRIVAIKSIGGFQLACDATSDRAVMRLRRRKNRPRKPLALMCSSTAVARRFCRVNRDAAALVGSVQAPVVLLPKHGKPRLRIADGVAPGNLRLGVMLPYTPLHSLLFAELRRLSGSDRVLVMTSANPKDDPIAASDHDLRQRLGKVCDSCLTNDRPIANRCDDSVVMPLNGAGFAFVRRARGYAPQPVELAPMFHVKHPVLAVGAEWKNCFCLAAGGKAYMSPHIGSVATESGEAFWRDTLARYQRWTGIRPAAIACDLHPDYIATRLAERLSAELDLPLVRVQHHYAHILSVLAETGVRGRVLGIACDGTGYGLDGTIWGCEFIVVNPDRSWERVGTLRPMRLADAGAEVADPLRTGRAYLAQASDTKGRHADHPEANPGSALCSSLGRLYDAVAGITGICGKSTFDAEAAIALESAADPRERGRYSESAVLNVSTSPAMIDPRPVVMQVSHETSHSIPARIIAARFQNTVSQAIGGLAVTLGKRHGIDTVALSGGSFQNARLWSGVTARLRRAGVNILAHRSVPANDGGIALGQAVAASK